MLQTISTKNTINKQLLEETPVFCKTKVFTSSTAFSELKPHWNHLVEQSPHPHPFILREWLANWWKIYARKRDELQIIAVYHHNTIIGIAPFYIQRRSLLNTLRFIGEGEKQDEAVVTHYPDIICQKHYQYDVIEAIAQCLNELRKDWDVAFFSFLLKDSTLYKLGKKLSGISELIRPIGKRYRLLLPETNIDFLKSLGKSTQKNIRSKTNRMKKMGELALYTPKSQFDKQQTYDKLANLHRYRKSRNNQTSIFNQTKFNQYHLSLVSQFSDHDTLQFKVLQHDNQSVAIAYSFLINNQIFSYISGFKSQDDHRFSPMLVFDALEMETLIEQQVESYDFLSTDDADTYKKHYGCEETPVKKLYWMKNTPKAFVISILLKLYNFLGTCKKIISQKS